MASGGRWAVPAPEEACLSRPGSPCEGVTPTCTLPGDKTKAMQRGGVLGHTSTTAREQ